MSIECHCGGEVKYDADGCGHEWLDCLKCTRHLETYQSSDIFDDWRQLIATEKEEVKNMKKSIETINFGNSKIPVWIISNGQKMMFDRPAYIDEDGGSPLSQIRDDECIVSPGAIYRVANK